MAKIKVGDKAPEISGIDQNGKEISSNQLKGKKVVLYFYPKDNTPGCTAEACNLRDNFQQFVDNGFVVIGVSADNQESHTKFIQKFSLPFPLIADVDKKLLKAFDAWGEKKMYGKVYEGVLRKTYIIDEKGIITGIIDKVKTDDHSNQLFGVIHS